MCSGHLFRLEFKGRYKNKKDGSITPEYIIIKDKEEYIKALKANPMTKYTVEQIPCGVCMECRLKNSKEWAFRCMKEAEEHKSNLMLTLTYNDENLPKGAVIDENTGEILKFTTPLWKREHQLFMKKMRKWWNKEIVPKERPKKGTEELKDFWKRWNIKFKLCGEYGSDAEYKDWKGNIRKGTKRPHFHIIVFGLDLPDLEFHKWSKCDWSKEKNALFKSKILDKLWSKGIAEVNEVNFETCAYVSRYIMKKQLGKGAKEHYENNGLTPEYSCSSNRPGIGNEYFYKNIEKFLNDEKHFIKTKKKILEIGSIRYYDKLLEKEYPEEFEEIKKKRRKRSLEILNNILKETGISESEYIDNRTRKTEKKTKKLIRPLV